MRRRSRSSRNRRNTKGRYTKTTAARIPVSGERSFSRARLLTSNSSSKTNTPAQRRYVTRSKTGGIIRKSRMREGRCWRISWTCIYRRRMTRPAQEMVALMPRSKSRSRRRRWRSRQEICSRERRLSQEVRLYEMKNHLIILRSNTLKQPGELCLNSLESESTNSSKRNNPNQQARMTKNTWKSTRSSNREPTTRSASMFYPE